MLGRDVLSRVLDGGWELLLMARGGNGARGRARGCRRASTPATGAGAPDTHDHAGGRRAARLSTARVRAAAGVGRRAERVAARGRGRALARAPGGARAPRGDARRVRARLRQGRGDHRGLEPAGDEPARSCRTSSRR